MRHDPQELQYQVQALLGTMFDFWNWLLGCGGLEGGHKQALNKGLNTWTTAQPFSRAKHGR